MQSGAPCENDTQMSLPGHARVAQFAVQNPCGTVVSQYKPLTQSESRSQPWLAGDR